MGGERLVAARHKEHVGVGAAAVRPPAEAVAAGGCGMDLDGVAESVGACTADAAAGAARHRGRHRAAGAERGGGHDAYHRRVVLVVGARAVAAHAAHAGVERPRGEVAVVQATPAPVEVEEPVVVVAVADEGVAAAGSAARVQQRVASVKFAHQDGVPFGGRVVEAPHGAKPRTVFEVLHQRCLRRLLDGAGTVVGAGAAAVGSVAHLHCHADVVHQQRHCVGLGACRVGPQCRRHQAPGV